MGESIYGAEGGNGMLQLVGLRCVVGGRLQSHGAQPILLGRASIVKTQGSYPQATLVSGTSGFDGRFRRDGGNLESLALDAQQHAAEDNAMQRCDRIPVQ